MAIITDGTRKFEVNYSPASGSGGQVLYTWVQVLLAAGWTAVDWGNGTTTGSGTMSSANWNASNAWQRVQAPAGTLQMTIQKDTTDFGARAYLSVAGFSGSGTATAPPTPPADAIQFIGTGNAFDTAGFMWSTQGNASNVVWHICADTANVNGAYYFHIVGRTKTTGAAQRRVVCDPTENNTGGIDVAPFYMLRGTADFPNAGTGGNILVAWYKYGLSGASLETVLYGATVGGYPNSFSTNPYTTESEMCKIPITQTTGNAQDKGMSSTCRWTGRTLANYDTANLAVVGNAYIHHTAGWLLPWPSGVTPVP